MVENDKLNRDVTADDVYTGEGLEGDSSKWVQIFQFVLIPLGIVMIMVILFIGLNWLFSDTQSINELVTSDLKSRSPVRRGIAAMRLKDKLLADDKLREDKALLKEVIDAFKSEQDIDTKKLLAVIFRVFMSEDAVPVLVDTLNDEKVDSRVKIECIGALGAINSKTAVPTLIRILDDADSGIRSSAAITLGYLQDASAIEPLKTKLKDGQEDVRWNSALALAKFKDNSCREMLYKMLDRQYVSTISKEDYLIEYTIGNAISAVYILLKGRSKTPTTAEQNSVKDNDFIDRITSLSKNDSSLKVRGLAISALKELTE